MSRRMLVNWVFIALLAGCAGQPSGQTLPTQTLNLSVSKPAHQPGPSNPNLWVDSLGGAIYRPDFNTWSLISNNRPVTFTLTLPEKMPVVVTFSVAAALVQEKPNSPVSITVNDSVLVHQYADTDPHFHPVAWKIPRSMVKVGANTIGIHLAPGATVQYFINAVTAASFDEPQRLISNNGTLGTNLYVQFALANITGAVDSSNNPVPNEIWTRAYGLIPPQPDPADTSRWLPNEDLVPGPTLVFRPNDVMNLNFVNNLNKSRSKWLKDFQGSITPTNPDDVEEHVSHEVNIPHNANNTNLHTHGLHVDPRRDNVTLVIIPEDDSPSNYNTMLQGYIPNATGSHVPGGPPGNGKYWTWRYSYKIPADHMPGTHWFHAHKHGSTSTHVENGMAGTFVIRPMRDSNTFTPGLWNDNADLSHDRVMVLQETANYGIQQGSGKSEDVAPASGTTSSKATPDITVNGVRQPTLQLTKGQIERWRFVNAGANHRTSAYVWLGKKSAADIAQKVNNRTVRVPLYDNAVPDGVDTTKPQMYLVALDGVTLAAPIRITAKNPLLIAAGNRADVVVRIPEKGEYAIFKNYPNPQKPAKNQTVDPGGLTNITAPSAMNKDAYDLGTNNGGFNQNWIPYPGGSRGPQAIVPLLSGKLDSSDSNRVNINLTHSGQASFSGAGWQPVGAGGGDIDNQLLMFVNVVDGTPANSRIPTDLSRLHLSPFSPSGTADSLVYIDQNGQPATGKPPGYAAPIRDTDISIPPQVMVFDLAGIEFSYKGKNKIKQFSLNGRQFDLMDFVGNPGADTLIQKPVEDSVYAQGNKFLGTYDYTGLGNWTNRIAGLNNRAYWTNPGYYIPVRDTTIQDSTYYTYDYSSAKKPPTYGNIVGNVGPSQPQAQSAQEWLLINNSSIFHPFHIHISPFFVTEIGQLNYDTKNGWRTHYIYNDPHGTPPKRQSYEKEVTSAVPYVVGSWWDVMMIPPHGYVKFKTWINVPWQSDNNSVTENTNNVGAWVFHCHILRHEDRGMMMMVKTKTKKSE